jgi:hypothetical protein
MTPLVVGVLLAIATLAYVMWPLFRGAGERATVPNARGAVPRRAEDLAVRALREIEFDRATGKLSDSDYEQLKARFTADAVRAIRAAGDAAAPAHATTASPVTDTESLVRAARSGVRTCPLCDTIAPEPGAVYCSTCGGFLPGVCAHCGSPVGEASARFCASCGNRLAA